MLKVKERYIAILNLMKFLEINNSIKFLEYLKPYLKNSNKKMYFFFDEIQMVKDWEKVVNGLLVDFDCDIYITGSNSTLISGDISIYLLDDM